MKATTIRLETYAAHETLAALKGKGAVAKRVALFVAAPFLGLVYALALPFVGIGLLGWLAVRAAVRARAA